MPTPRPAAGEVLVRTVCSGISGGTERLVYRGEVPDDLALDDTIDALGGAFSYPFAYGFDSPSSLPSLRAVPRKIGDRTLTADAAQADWLAYAFIAGAVRRE